MAHPSAQPGCQASRDGPHSGVDSNDQERAQSPAFRHRVKRSLVSMIPSLWTNRYFCSTVGGARLSVIKQYVENQKKV